MSCSKFNTAREANRLDISGAGECSTLTSRSVMYTRLFTILANLGTLPVEQPSNSELQVLSGILLLSLAIKMMMEQ